jgi:ketosteroid isomerase-like protein
MTALRRLSTRQTVSRLIVLAACASLGADAAARQDATALIKMQTQAMLDAVTAGDPKVWDRYLDPAMIYLAEDGTRKGKADLLKEIQPLPRGISGAITIGAFDVRTHGTVAVATHDDNERENYYGQMLNAQYRTTDTWLQTKDGWKLIASQVHAALIDPPSMQVPTARLDEYTGIYRLTPEISYSIRRADAGLSGERTGRPEQMLEAEAADVFFVPGQPRIRKIFLRDGSGHITGFVDRREGRDVKWERQK